MSAALGGSSNQAAAQSLPTPVAAAGRWSAADAAALYQEAQRSTIEGLNPERYDTDALRTAIDRGPADLDRVADHLALALAHDYAEGSVTGSARSDWAIGRNPIDYRAWLDGALARHDIATSLQELLPRTGGYAGLRDGLAHCDTPAHCLTIRVNLERWRWLPRALSGHYVWVNPAAYRLDLIENDKAVSSHRIIVGKVASSTPIFAATITGVTANPWWTVPQNIVAESVGKVVRTQPREVAKRGYVATRDASGHLHVRQKPGPLNALGLIKLEMPNPNSVFIHDTPSRDLFNKEQRAFSHGCIRTQNPANLARILLPPASVQQFDALLASGTNKTLALAEPVPVYVVYFTAEPDPASPGAISFAEDVYHRDSKVEAALRQ